MPARPARPARPGCAWLAVLTRPWLWLWRALHLLRRCLCAGRASGSWLPRLMGGWLPRPGAGHRPGSAVAWACCHANILPACARLNHNILNPDHENTGLPDPRPCCMGSAVVGLVRALPGLASARGLGLGWPWLGRVIGGAVACVLAGTGLLVRYCRAGYHTKIRPAWPWTATI